MQLYMYFTLNLNNKFQNFITFIDGIGMLSRKSKQIIYSFISLLGSTRFAGMFLAPPEQ